MAGITDAKVTKEKCPIRKIWFRNLKYITWTKIIPYEVLRLNSNNIYETTYSSQYFYNVVWLKEITCFIGNHPQFSLQYLTQ